MPAVLLQRLHKEPPPRAPYLVDVMLLANDGEREEGAGVRGVILWNEELEKDTQRPSWGGSETPREARGGTGGGRRSYEGHVGHSQGIEGSQRSLGPRSVLNIRGKRRVWIEWEDGEGWDGGVLHP